MVNIYIQDTDIEHLAFLRQKVEHCLCKKGYNGRVIMSDTSLENILVKSKETKKESLFILEYQPTEDFKLLALLIRRNNPSCYIILTIHNVKEALDNFPIGIRISNVYKRPVSYKQIKGLLNSMDMDYHQIRGESHDRFQFHIKNCEYYVHFSDILYFECSDKKITVKTTGKEYEFYGSLNKILSYAPRNFMRTHRGFLVNLDKVARVDYNQKTIIMIDGSQTLLSRSYKNMIRERLQDRIPIKKAKEIQ